VRAEHLQSEPCYIGKSDPKDNLIENGATDAEVDFLRGAWDDEKGYMGQRVELNAFTSGDLLRWIEGKLKGLGIRKIIPAGVTIEAAYRRAMLARLVENHLASFIPGIRKKVDAIALKPEQIAEDVGKLLQERPEMSWDQAIAEIVEHPGRRVQSTLAVVDGGGQ
jgi:hypothetical protein